MKQLDKYCTEDMKVGIIEEEGVSIIYVLWSVNGDVKSYSIVWIPTTSLEAWLNTEAADKHIRHKIATLGELKTKAMSFHEAKQQAAVEALEEEVKDASTNVGDKVFIHISTGEQVSIRNVSQFCRDRGLSYGSFKKMARGANKSSQGWKKG